MIFVAQALIFFFYKLYLGFCGAPDFTCLVNVVENCRTCNFTGNPCFICSTNYLLSPDRT